MFDTNPSLIQDGGQAAAEGNPSTTNTPLILIHDGGGTTFSYYLLEDLGRNLQGIANPRFHDGVPWEGGLHEMAMHYADLVAASVPLGVVILGGWSLGGLLALETADVLSYKYPAIHIVGLVFIDSVYPLPPPQGWGAAGTRLVERRIEWSPATKMETRIAVERCFREAHRMAREWMPPAAWRSAPSLPGVVGPTSKPPPAVLLRSKDPVPVPDGGLLPVDLYRDERHLGWDNYHSDLFCRVIDIPGNHFSVFAIDHIATVSSVIKAACETLESRPGARPPRETQ